MDSRSEKSMENHDYLEPLLARWEELREQGREVAAQQLCADRPEWAAALQQQIDRLKAMDWLDAPVDTAGHDSFVKELAEKLDFGVLGG